MAYNETGPRISRSSGSRRQGDPSTGIGDQSTSASSVVHAFFGQGSRGGGGRRNAHPRPSHSRLQGITMLTLIEETGRMSAPDYISSAFLGRSLGLSVAIECSFV